MGRRAMPTAILGGALLGAAYSVDWAWLMAPIAVAAFAWSLERAGSFKSTALLAAAFGWAGYVGGFFWLQPALSSFWSGRVTLSWTVWLLWGAWVAVRFVIIGLGYHALRARGLGRPLALTLPWVTVEWVYPAVFPFYLGNLLIDWPSMAQTAALGGPLLLTAWICMFGALISEAVSSLQRGARVRPREILVVMVTTLLALAYGRMHITTLEAELAEAPALKVGVVQANVDVMRKRTERALSHRRHVEQSTALVSETDIDLLIWPETSYLYPVARILPAAGEAIAGMVGRPLLFGGIRKEDDGRRFNSAMLLDDDGVIRSAYDKRFLIPFAEFVPLGNRFPWWNDAAPTLSRFHRGGGPSALELGEWRIATPICYETIRPRYVRALVRLTGANLLVSLTNDGWFGDSPEPRIHLRLARLRAIEQGRYLVRATNTGISAIVDPMGRVVARTEIFESANLVGEARMLDRPTLYATTGDWPGWLSAIVGLLLLGTTRR